MAHPVSPPIDGNGGDDDGVEVQRSDLGPLPRLSDPVRALLQGAGGDDEAEGFAGCGDGKGDLEAIHVAQRRRVHFSTDA